MFERFCMLQNLRALIQSELPEELSDLQSQFEKVFDTGRGGALEDLWFSDEGGPVRYSNTRDQKPLDDETWGLLKAWLNAENRDIPTRRPQVLWQHSVKRLNMTFSAREGRNNNGDSNVIWGDLQSDAWGAGRIRSIFVLPGAVPDIFLLVDELSALPSAEATKSPWQRYRSLSAGNVFQAQTHSSRILHLDKITCHAAAIPFGSKTIRRGCVHFIPLERVSLVYWPFL